MPKEIKRDHRLQELFPPHSPQGTVCALLEFPISTSKS